VDCSRITDDRADQIFPGIDITTPEFRDQMVAILNESDNDVVGVYWSLEWLHWRITQIEFVQDAVLATEHNWDPKTRKLVSGETRRIELPESRAIYDRLCRQIATFDSVDFSLPEGGGGTPSYRAILAGNAVVARHNMCIFDIYGIVEAFSGSIDPLPSDLLDATLSSISDIHGVDLIFMQWDVLAQWLDAIDPSSE
jgi:hypothetical protein